MNSTVDLSEAKRALLQMMLQGDGKHCGREIETVIARVPGTTVPISAEQRHVWLHASMAPDLPLYNEPITIHRKGSFDLLALERSINEILRRHEIWRTSFALVDEDPIQVVHPDLQIHLSITDLTDWPELEREAEAVRIAIEDARKPFALNQTPLFRAKVCKLAADVHRLYLTLHHIIFDGVSIYRVFMPELAALYEAFASGQAPEIVDPPLQYADYAVWQAHSVPGDQIAEQINYWRQQLDGRLPISRLPMNRPRPPMLSYRGSMETFNLTADLTGRLKELSRLEGVTLYMALLSAFKVLLFRYGDQEDILVGGVIDTRRRPELEQLMGYFLNTVALRTRPRREMPFRQFLAMTRDTVLGALSASDVPFNRVVQELQPTRDSSRHPLFQVLFSIEPPVTQFADGWDLTQMDVTVGMAKFDLYLELDERADDMIGRFLYNTDLFDPPTIRRMIGHWIAILEGAVANPDLSLALLPIVTHGESRQLLVEWNDTRHDYPEVPLHELIAAQAARTPHVVAVEFDGYTLTYWDLDQRADRLAFHLRGTGVTTETLVAICIGRSLNMVIGLLAILKAGGTYLPLDPQYPRARLAMMLEEAKPAVLLTQRHLSAVLPDSGALIVFCDDDFRAAAVQSGTPATVSADNLAYVLFTSGSTGKPNAVEITHRSVVNLLTSMQRTPGFVASDRLLAVTTLSFDIAALELFLPLVSGGRLILAKRDVAADPFLLAELIHRSECTVMQATPATWRALIEAGWTGRSCLKILSGGEALSGELANELLRRGLSLWNMYGPTETTIWSTVHKVEKGGGTVPIGRPIANTTIYILDSGGNVVPADVPGELYIGGLGVARGYRNSEGLTQERFATRTVAPGERLYRTGDLACYRCNGVIECLGRADNQVKIRGFRVALEEIEATIEAHPEVVSAVVRAWSGAPGEDNLVAYLVFKGDPVRAESELRHFLQQTLPAYMIPWRFVWMAALPMTLNGKVDRQALPEPAAAPTRASFAAPSGPIEQKLAEIWKDILRTPDIETCDDFFSLGGHSLLVPKLLGRIEKDLGRRLPTTAIYHAPTIRQMAALLSNTNSAMRLSRTIQIQPTGSLPPLFWIDAGPTFRALAEALGPDQPFLGIVLHPHDLQELGQSFQLADVAARHVQTIRAFQPSGPYFVGGWCTSGIVAYEVASQLIADGHQVGLLTMVHSTNPVHFRGIGRTALGISKLKYHLVEAARQRSPTRSRYVLERFDGLLQSLSRSLVNSDRPTTFDVMLYEAALDYVPQPYQGDVALFQPAARPDVLDYRPGWAEVVRGEFAAFDIPGAHRTMLEHPNVQKMAARLRVCLNSARTDMQFRQRPAN